MRGAMLMETFAFFSSSLRRLLIAGAFIGLMHAAGVSANESECARMLGTAPESIRLLDAVQSCGGVDAGCAYVEPTAGYGVLTLMCPHTTVLQVIYADRLRSLQLRDGTWLGECSSGSWQRDAGLPGCYPAPVWSEP
jgi:hypothetical protein